MDFTEYLKVLRRRWILVLSCTAVVVAVAALLTLRAVPEYASSARVFISASASKADTDPNNAYTGGLAASQRVQSYATLVSDGELAQRVVSALDLNMTPGQLSGSISAQVLPDTVVLQLSVTNPSAREAQVICREVVDQMLILIGEIETPPGENTPLLKGTVTAPATLPTAPVTPDVPRNILIGLVLGLLFGLAAAVARELLDTTLKSGRQVEETLNAPILGGIAFDAQAAKTPLITSLGSHDPRTEAFRVLRTNLQFVDVDNEKKVIVVTSSTPGEGKSTTAVNVAITLAQAGQRVLIVDGDLRRPAVAGMLGLENAVGVTTVLLGRVDLEDALQTHSPSGLSVLASGSVPPNPAELLQSHAMSELLGRLRQDFDLVVVDSPPLLPVTDAALIARQADGAVVVVRYGDTTKDQLVAANDRLVGVGAHVLGAVFNRLKTKGSSYGGSTGFEYGYGYSPAAGEQTLAGADQSAAVADRSTASESAVDSTRGASVLSITQGRVGSRAAPASVDDAAEEDRDDLTDELLGRPSEDRSFPGRHRS